MKKVKVTLKFQNGKTTRFDYNFPCDDLLHTKSIMGMLESAFLYDEEDLVERERFFGKRNKNGLETFSIQKFTIESFPMDKMGQLIKKK